MPAKRSSPLLTALRLGSIGGGVALLLSLMGMVEALSERDIIAGVISTGIALLVAIFMVFGFSAARAQSDSSPATRIAVGTLTGAIGELFLVGLVILGQNVDLRPVFPSASPELYALLQFGRTGTQAYVIMLVFGAVVGALGAGLALTPARARRAIIVGLTAVTLSGLLEDLIHITLATAPGLVVLADRILARGVESGLKPGGAVFVFLLFGIVTFFWGPIRTGIRAGQQAVPPSQRHRAGLLIYGLLVVILLLLPKAFGPYLTEVSNSVMIFAVMAVGLNIVVGFAGLLDLGYVAFFAIGAYTMAVLTTTAVGAQRGQIVWGPHLTFWEALPIAVLFSILAGVLLGIPVLRMRGDYLAIVTLGFGEIVRIMALSDALKPYIGGSQGMVEIGVPNLGQVAAALSSQELYYYLMLAVLFLVIFIALRLRDSRQGRRWMAMREDEDVAQAVGIRLVSTKLLAFASGAAMAGLAGAIFASKVGSVYPHSFNLLVSINVLAVVIVGGMGSIPGVVAGALVLFGLPELLREFSEYRYFVFGAVLIAMMLYKPEGLWPEAKRRQELHEADESEPRPEVMATSGGAGSA